MGTTDGPGTEEIRRQRWGRRNLDKGGHGRVRRETEKGGRVERMMPQRKDSQNF